MKRRLAVGGVLLSLLAILALGTAAYFSTSGRAQNEITMGTVQLNLTESITLDDGKVEDATTAKVEGILPGKTVQQTATVENTGSQDYWLRVKMDVEILGKDGTTALADEVVDPKTGETVPVISFNVDTTEKWEADDGWYYYKEQVPSGASVNPFTEVTFASAAGNAYQGCTINIKVDAQAVQVEHNDIPENGSILDVKGWPDDTDTGFEVDPEEPGTGGETTDPEGPAAGGGGGAEEP